MTIQLVEGHRISPLTHYTPRPVRRAGHDRLSPSALLSSSPSPSLTRTRPSLSSSPLQIVYAQVSQENIPLGPLATLMPLLQMAGVLNENNIKNALKQVRECQEQLVVLDRTHSIKVRGGRCQSPCCRRV